LRSSVILEWDGTRILVDAGLDFRQQALRAGIDRLDGVWFTHSHADHTGGVDDLRPYCFGGRVLPVAGLSSVMDELHHRFAYAFRTEADLSGVSHPLLRSEIITPELSFLVGGREIVPLPAEHGPFPVVGFRVGPVAYLTDVSRVPETTLAKMEGLDVLVLSALRDEPHPTHLSFTQAITLARRIGARRTWFTHFAHGRCHAELEELFPEGMSPAFDGLVISA
jgi:phosphoribosyl 1,2-cyclic phosphate phosphodiesterase